MKITKKKTKFYSCLLETFLELGPYVARGISTAYLLVTINYMNFFFLLLYRETNFYIVTKNFILLVINELSFHEILNYPWSYPAFFWMSFLYSLCLSSMITWIYILHINSSKASKMLLTSTGIMIIIHQYILCIFFLKFNIYQIAFCILSPSKCSGWGSYKIYITIIHTTMDVLLYSMSTIFLNNFFIKHDALGKIPSKLDFYYILYTIWVILSFALKSIVEPQTYIYVLLSIDIATSTAVWIIRQSTVTYLNLRIQMYIQILQAIYIFMSTSNIIGNLIGYFDIKDENIISFESVLNLFGVALCSRLIYKYNKQKLKNDIISFIVDESVHHQHLNAVSYPSPQEFLSNRGTQKTRGMQSNRGTPSYLTIPNDQSITNPQFTQSNQIKQNNLINQGFQWNESNKTNSKRQELLLKIMMIVLNYIEEKQNRNQIFIYEKPLTEYEIMIQGIIYNHKRICNLVDCCCQKLQPLTQSDFYLYQKSQKGFIASDWYIIGKILNDYLLNELNLNKKNINTLLIFCIFHLRVFKNHLIPIYYLNYCLLLQSHHSHSFGNARNSLNIDNAHYPFASSSNHHSPLSSNYAIHHYNMIYVVRKMITQNIKNSQNYIEISSQFNQIFPVQNNFLGEFSNQNQNIGSFDFEKTIRFEKKFNLLYNVTNTYIMEQKNMYQFLYFEPKNIVKLNGLLFTLEYIYKQIHLIIPKLHRLFDQYYKIYLIFGCIVFFLRNDFLLSKSLFRKAIRIKENSNFKFVSRVLLPDEQLSCEIICIQGNIHKDRFGIINYMTMNSQKLLKMPFNYFLNKNINELIPHAYKSIHENCIRDFLKKGEARLINKPFDTFVNCANDFIVPVKSIKKLSNNLFDGLQIISMISPIDKFNACCLCNQKGTIYDVSEEFAKLFKLHPKHFKTCRTNITFLSSELKKVVNIFDVHYNLDIEKQWAMSMKDIPEPTKKFTRSDTSFTNLNSPLKLNQADTSIDDMLQEQTFSGDNFKNEDNAKIIQKYEREQGGSVIFKISKNFIRIQKKKNNVLQFPTLRPKTSTPTETNSFPSKSGRSAFFWFSIKLKLKKLLKKVREKIQHASNYVIKANVQIIYLQSSNGVVKAFVVKKIFSAGWEQKTKKPLSNSKKKGKSQFAIPSKSSLHEGSTSNKSGNDILDTKMFDDVNYYPPKSPLVIYENKNVHDENENNIYSLGNRSFTFNVNSPMLPKQEFVNEAKDANNKFVALAALPAYESNFFLENKQQKSAKINEKLFGKKLEQPPSSLQKEQANFIALSDAKLMTFNDFPDSDNPDIKIPDKQSDWSPDKQSNWNSEKQTDWNPDKQSTRLPISLLYQKRMQKKDNTDSHNLTIQQLDIPVERKESNPFKLNAQTFVRQSTLKKLQPITPTSSKGLRGTLPVHPTLPTSHNIRYNKSESEFLKSDQKKNEAKIHVENTIKTALSQYSMKILDKYYYKGEKLKELNNILNKPFNPHILKTFFLVNNLSFILFLFLEMMSVGVIVLLVYTLCNKINETCEYSKMFNVQAWIDFELNLYDYITVKSINQNLLSHIGIDSIQYFLLYSSIREKLSYLASISHLLQFHSYYYQEKLIQFIDLSLITQTKVFHLIHQPISNNIIPAIDFYFYQGKAYLYDMFTQILFIFDETQNEINMILNLFICLDIVLLVLMIVAVFLLAILLKRALKAKVEMLNIFYDIPKPTIKKHIKTYAKIEPIILGLAIFNTANESSLTDNSAKTKKAKETPTKALTKKIKESDHSNLFKFQPKNFQIHQSKYLLNSSSKKILFILFIYLMLEVSGVLIKKKIYDDQKSIQNAYNTLLSWTQEGNSLPILVLNNIQLISLNSSDSEWIQELANNEQKIPSFEIQANLLEYNQTLMETLVNGSIIICDFFRCPPSYYNKTLYELISTIRTSLYLIEEEQEKEQNISTNLFNYLPDVFYQETIYMCLKIWPFITAIYDVEVKSIQALRNDLKWQFVLRIVQIIVIGFIGIVFMSFWFQPQISAEFHQHFRFLRNIPIPYLLTNKRISSTFFTYIPKNSASKIKLVNN